ncbi:MAG: hypothetical protein ACYTE3_00780 [Planctomycetota bacterium]|jgi:hypothetical protein
MFPVSRRKILKSFGAAVVGVAAVDGRQRVLAWQQLDSQKDDNSMFDPYGGIKSVRSKASGFFRVEKLDGRWWFITPAGHGFISAGVNHVDYKGDYSQDFVRFVVKNLKDWGFNTVGWSQEVMQNSGPAGGMVHSPGWGPEQYASARMPYVHLIRFTDMEHYVQETFPDVFGDEWTRKCDTLSRQVCTKLREDPFLIGYCYSDTPNMQLWRQRCGSDKFPKVLHRYYTTIAEAIRRYDRNHLLLGDRYKADQAIRLDDARVRGVLDEALEAMRDTVDVLCLEYYRPDKAFEANLKRWHGICRKPVLLADSAFHAPTDALKMPPSSPTYVPDQAARGKAYARLGRRVYSNPLVIGWHWCAFGRSPARRSGLLDGNDKPYRECVEQMHRFNKNEVYPIAIAAGERTSANPDKNRDQYGATRKVRSSATGFFRVEEIDGRWWFVSPEGHGFISMGMNHLDLAALKHLDNIHIFRNRYDGNTDTFIRKGIAEPLRDWGFNTIGWSQECVGGVWMDPKRPLRHSHEWTHRQFRTAGLPFVYNFVFAEIESFNFVARYPDLFDDDFENWADYLARLICVDMADEALLLGYADVPVPDFTSGRQGSWSEGLDLEDEADLRKLKRIVRRYFDVTTKAIRRYDKNHMLFGPRFRPGPSSPDWLIEIVGEYFDVLLCNNFVPLKKFPGGPDHWHALTGRPILIADMAFLAPTELLKFPPGAPAYVPDQAARGEAYVRFNQEALRRPHILGQHWCAFLENRNRKSGIKNYMDEPYWECVNRMKDFNLNRLYQTALEPAR